MAGKTFSHPGYIQQKEDLVFKVVTIGDYGVGKTSLYLRYVNDSMEPVISNHPCEFMTEYLKVDDKVIKLKLWDTYGQERYRCVTRSYYRGSHGLLVVFDLTNMKSFQNIHQWITDCGESSEDTDITTFLVGTKADLREKRQVPYLTAKKVADELGIVYIETSALAGWNVSRVFRSMTGKIKQRVDEGTLQGAESGHINCHEHNDPLQGQSCSC